MSCRPIYYTLLLLAWAAAGLSPVAPARAGEPVTVELMSGRSFAGEVDSRTDSRRLWLRSGRPGLVFLRPIEWQRVHSAMQDGTVLSGEALRETAAGWTAQAAAELPVPDGAKETIAPVSLPTSVPEGDSPSPSADSWPASAHRPEVFCPPPIRSMEVDVHVANWDDDVEVDGLILHLFPLSDMGELVPVRGTLAVELVGEQLGVTRHRQEFPELGRWSQGVSPEDFGPAGAVYRLEFQGTHPEFDLDVGSHGVAHAELTVPGEGTFHASQSTVRVRPYSPLRDRLQQRSGRRFWPRERTGPGR